MNKRVSTVREGGDESSSTTNGNNSNALTQMQADEKRKTATINKLKTELSGTYTTVEELKKRYQQAITMFEKREDTIRNLMVEREQMAELLNKSVDHRNRLVNKAQVMRKHLDEREKELSKIVEHVSKQGTDMSRIRKERDDLLKNRDKLHKIKRELEYDLNQSIAEGGRETIKVKELQEASDILGKRLKQLQIEKEQTTRELMDTREAFDTTSAKLANVNKELSEVAETHGVTTKDDIRRMSDDICALKEQMSTMSCKMSEQILTIKSIPNIIEEKVMDGIASGVNQKFEDMMYGFRENFVKDMENVMRKAINENRSSFSSNGKDMLSCRATPETTIPTEHTRVVANLKEDKAASDDKTYFRRKSCDLPPIQSTDDNATTRDNKTKYSKKPFYLNFTSSS